MQLPALVLAVNEQRLCPGRYVRNDGKMRQNTYADGTGIEARIVREPFIEGRRLNADASAVFVEIEHKAFHGGQIMPLLLMRRDCIPEK